jgi:hypothetical protein
MSAIHIESPNHNVSWPPPSRELAFGQIGAVGLILLCVALHPGFVLKANEGGMSNYGVHIKTTIPYSCGLLLAACTALRSARLFVGSATTNTFNRLLILYGVLTIVTLATTYGYTLNTPLKDFHLGVGVIIETFEFLSSVWMFRNVRRNSVAVAIGIVGYALALLTYVGLLHLLFLTQVLIGTSFGVLLVGSSRTLRIND